MRRDRYYGDGVISSSPYNAPVMIAPAAFIVCPLRLYPCGLDAGPWMQDVYRLAYEQTRAALLPPRHERLLLASPN